MLGLFFALFFNINSVQKSFLIILIYQVYLVILYIRNPHATSKLNQQAILEVTTSLIFLTLGLVGYLSQDESWTKFLVAIFLAFLNTLFVGISFRNIFRCQLAIIYKLSNKKGNTFRFIFKSIKIQKS